VVQAESPHEAVEKTVKWAVNIYPGMFAQVDEKNVRVATPGFPIFSEIGGWN
jgi:hypothetical protein